MSGSSLLFAVTAAFSIHGVYYYRKNGSSPEYSIQDAENQPIEDQDYSANTSDKLNDHENMQLNKSDEDETPITHTSAEEQTHPSGPITWNLQQPHTALDELGFEPVDTSYYSSKHPYESLQRPQSRPSSQYPANTPGYEMYHPNESHFIGGLRPLPVQVGGGPSRHNLALEYDHGGYASGDRVSFPEGDYSR